MEGPLRRYSESNAPIAGAEINDFVERQHRPPNLTIYILFVVAFAASVIAAQFIEEMGGGVIFGLLLLGIYGILALAVVHYLQRHRDMVLATEFQNALFTSAANLRTRFNLIVNRNGAITYYSPNYPKVFRDARRKGLTSFDSLLDSEGISEDDNYRVRSAMAEGRHEHILCSLTNIDGDVERLRLSLSPIPRPKGFFLVSVSELERRRDRRTDASSPEAVLLSEAFNNVPCGVLTADLNDVVKHINRTLEKWLGYGHGEVTASQLKRTQLIASLSMGNDAYQGTVNLIKKDGSRIEAELTQTPILDLTGSPAGSCSVLQLPEKKTS